MKVAFLSNHRAGYQEILEKQLTRAGVDFIVGVDPHFSWKRRMVWTRDVAAAYPKEKLVFLDAWDTLFCGDKVRLSRALDGDSIWLTASKQCWPDEGRIPEFLAKGDVEGPWRFINATPLSGPGEKIAAAIDWGWERFPIEDDTIVLRGSSEEFWTNLYLRSPFDIRIDNKCRIGQLYSGASENELFVGKNLCLNLVHGTAPVFFHANLKSMPPEILLEVGS